MILSTLDHILDKLIEIFTPSPPPDKMIYCPNCGGTGFDKWWLPCKQCATTGFVPKPKEGS